MRASHVLKPVGGLAVALGLGSALFGSGAVARAEPVDQQGSESRAAARAEATPRLRQHRPARGSTPASPSRVAVARQQPARAARPSASARASGRGLAAVFANQSPQVNPTRNPQAADGQITGDLNAIDIDGDALSYTLTGGPGHGTVTVDASGGFRYVPDAAVAATGVSDSFVVSVSDAGTGFHVHGLPGLINLLAFGLFGLSGHVTTATVRLTVNPFGPANTTPTATAVAGFPDPNTGVVTGAVTGSDADGDTLTYSAPAGTAKGSVSIDTATGAFTYTPTATARHSAALLAATPADGTDSFAVTVSDGHGGTATATVTVVIGPQNAGPLADIPDVGPPNDSTGAVTGAVTGSDADGDPLTYSAPAGTAKGSVSIDTATGAFTYTPTAAAREAAGLAGASDADQEDTFTVTITDGHGGTAAAAVTVTVQPAAAPPPPNGNHLAVGMNLENVVDWSPAWTFTDAFKASRPWISQTFNPQTFVTTWDPAAAPTLDVDADGNVRSLKTWNQSGVAMNQYAATLMFDALGGDYAAGAYHAEWDGTGVVVFGFDAVVTSSGKTAGGRNFADLAVTPTDNGIYLQIQSTSPTDPVRDFNVWMPDYNGQSFVGQRWTPGAAFSPFHPLFLARLDPFGALRFMAMQETNTSDIVTWSQRRDAGDIRQGSGSEGTPSEPIANGISVEYMVELANELDADPWFNMPYQADDTFVRNFAGYVATHLEPGRTVYVEWANEVWNFGYGFEASQWVAAKAQAAGLDPDFGQWIVAGQEAKRDLDIWSQVFAGQSGVHLVRVAGGWAAVSWVTNQVLENMGGSFDAIAIAPYITPTDEQRVSYSGSTTVERIIADTRTNIATSVQWTADHEQLAADWSARLGRPIQLVAYEGGAHLDGRGASYQNAFYAAGNDPRMGGIYRDYIRALDAAGLDLYMDFQFTGQAGAAPWGDFAKLHRMNESLTTAYRYNAVVAAANGSLWNV